MNSKIKNILRYGASALIAAIVITGPSSLTAAAPQTASLIPGGMTFGVKLFTEGVLIVGVGDVKCGEQVFSPALDAGIMENDMITAIDGKAVTDTAEAARLISESNGSAIDISVKRGETELTFSVTPVITDDGSYKTGLIIRDGAAGIGTVTFIDPNTGSFAGLGHGICDTASGELVPMTRGAVVGAEINGVTKGQRGTPGELQGYFCTGKLGTVTKNTDCGIYGVFCDIPKGLYTEPIPTAQSWELHEGDAEVLCTTGEDGIGRYTVSISDIDNSGRETKNFTVTVTDPELLLRTGGIVQGMSGSPILQDGKLIGAVTHVLVKDPTKGYGIFIGNMLDKTDK